MRGSDLLPAGRHRRALSERDCRGREPRPEEDGLVEAGYLRRQGVHVILTASTFTIVGQARRAGRCRRPDSLPRSRARWPGERGAARCHRRGRPRRRRGAESRPSGPVPRPGLYHLLAVSGQNVAYVVAGMLALAWLLGVSRWIGQIGALVAVGGYLMAVGWQPSVVRAGGAGGLASLAWLAGRARDRYLLVGAASSWPGTRTRSSSRGSSCRSERSARSFSPSLGSRPG